MNEWIAWPHIHGTPVYGAFPNGRAFLYVWPEKDHLKSFSWQGNRFNPISKVATILPDYRLAALAPPYLMDFTGAVGMPGGMLSLAVDSSQQGSGVLFASVQRCRQFKDERSRPECMYSLCDNPEN